MAKKRAPAKAVAKPYGLNGYWIEYATIVEEDYEWLAPVERLALRNVLVPDGFISRLPNLWWLNYGGGSSTDLEIIDGVSKLKYLRVVKVRGMRDLSNISECTSLRRLDLYGLAQVTHLPSCSPLCRLEHVLIGQLRRLQSLQGVLEAPNLRELELINKINVSEKDVQMIINHPSIKLFNWSAADVPDKVWVPVVERIGLPPVPCGHPEDWFSRNKSPSEDE